MDELGVIYLLAVINYVTARAIHPQLMLLLTTSGAVRQNHAGEDIPYLAGITLVLSSVGGIYLAGQLLPINAQARLLIGLVILMGTLGLLDDVLGGSDGKGFRGHLTALVKKRKLTTGLLKAVGGGLMAVLAAVTVSVSPGTIVVNTLIVALTTNLINLFDLRPGRALKVFYLLWALLLLVPGNFLPRALLSLVAAPALAVLPWDLTGDAMLGDVGANVLGVSLGVALMWALPVMVKLPLVAALIWLHWYSERQSFTQAINNNQLLSRLDGLGRK